MMEHVHFLNVLIFVYYYSATRKIKHFGSKGSCYEIELK